GKTMIRAPNSVLRKGIDGQPKPPASALLDALRANAGKHIYIDWQRGLRKNYLPSMQTEDELYNLVHQFKPLQAVKGKQVAFTLGQELLIESRIQFGTAAEADKAVSPLKELLHLRRFIEPGIIMASLDK